jgi:gamma-glutamyltranspeptidase/glutathione hydrolase
VDRTTHLGDPDYVQVPKDKLLNEDYLKNRFHDINMKKATPSSEIKEGYVERIETIETTHYSIVDTQKNAVSITTTLNGNFGSKVVVEGAGFFLNNNMDDFTAKPGHANMFGLVGGIPNIIEPGKRMLSSMTPTILEKEGNLFMVLGTPGGSTIITSVFQTILNVIEHNMGMQEAINAKKVHHQWLPDHILAETGAIDSLIHEDLNEMGHKIVPVEKIGRIEGILIKPDGSIEAGADYTRGDDTALAY